MAAVARDEPRNEDAECPFLATQADLKAADVGLSITEALTQQDEPLVCFFLCIESDRQPLASVPLPTDEHPVTRVLLGRTLLEDARKENFSSTVLLHDTDRQANEQVISRLHGTLTVHYVAPKQFSCEYQDYKDHGLRRTILIVAGQETRFLKATEVVQIFHEDILHLSPIAPPPGSGGSPSTEYNKFRIRVDFPLLVRQVQESYSCVKLVIKDQDIGAIIGKAVLPSVLFRRIARVRCRQHRKDRSIRTLNFKDAPSLLKRHQRL